MADGRGISLILGVLTVAIGLAMAGCGSGSDSTPISKAEFVKRADAVCAEVEKKMSSGLRSFIARYEGKEPEGAAARTAAQAALIETVMAPNKRNEAEQLREIGSPKGDEDQVEAIADTLDEGVDEAEKRPQAAVNGELKALLKAEKLAGEYGLENC
jgi:hypothetical protein